MKKILLVRGTITLVNGDSKRYEGLIRIENLKLIIPLIKKDIQRILNQVIMNIDIDEIEDATFDDMDERILTMEIK